MIIIYTGISDDCTSIGSMDSSFKVLVTPPVRRRSSSTRYFIIKTLLVLFNNEYKLLDVFYFSDCNVCLDFEVNEMFMFASPLSLVLAFRKISAHQYDKSSKFLLLF